MDAACRDKWIGSICLGVTAFGWALNWPLMKLLLQQWPPLFSRGLAGVASAMILFSIAIAIWFWKAFGRGMIRGGIGVGLTDATPDFRFLAGYAYTF